MTRKTVFVSMNKIKNCVGRADYISSDSRQETLLFSFSNVDQQYWKSLQFETNHTAARELIIEIPNQFKPELDSQNNVIDDSRVRQFITEYANNFHERNKCDFIIGVHNNENNLHAHIMFNERNLEHPENIPSFKETVVPARYLVDGKRVKKSIYEKAIDDGNQNVEYQSKKINISIENKRFSIKNKKYETREWLENEKIEYTNFINNQKDIKNEWHRHIPEGHKPQLHIGKADPNIYKFVANKIEYNEEVKKYNKVYDWIKAKGFDIKRGVESYYQKYKESLIEVKNSFVEGNKSIKLDSIQKQLDETIKYLNEYIDEKNKIGREINSINCELSKLIDNKENQSKNIFLKTKNKVEIEKIEQLIYKKRSTIKRLKSTYEELNIKTDTLKQQANDLKHQKTALKSEIRGFSLKGIVDKENLIKTKKKHKNNVLEPKINKNYHER